jgi:hypothetical protein
MSKAVERKLACDSMADYTKAVYKRNAKAVSQQAEQFMPGRQPDALG